jgi:hypothetical protein
VFCSRSATESEGFKHNEYFNAILCILIKIVSTFIKCNEAGYLKEGTLLFLVSKIISNTDIEIEWAFFQKSNFIFPYSIALIMYYKATYKNLAFTLSRKFMDNQL